MEPPRKAVFIAIEGIDAVGKRTQSTLLRAWLGRKGLTSATLSFPDYHTEIGKEIRRFFDEQVNYPPEAIHMLLAANRWEEKRQIQSIISTNDVVIVNRYTGSNLAYGISNGLDLEWLMNLEVGLPQPDLTFVLDDAPTSVSSRRVRNKDRYERNIVLQTKARGAYLRLAQRFGWKVINASLGIEGTGRALGMEVDAALNSERRTV